MRNIIFVLAALCAATTSAQAEQLWLTMDQVRPFKVERPAQNIVVGNPAIADVTVQDNENIFLFGKSPGLTNIYIFDEKGETISNLMVRVRSQNSDMLTFHHGSRRTTYNCTSNCERTITVGDNPDIFAETSEQVKKKFEQVSTLGASNTD